MAEGAAGATAPLDAVIARQERIVEMLREVADGKPPSDTAWGELGRAQELLDELLRDQRERKNPEP